MMDGSTSMDGFINKLADEILVVDEALATEGLPNAPQYGLVVFADDAQIQNGGAAYMDASPLRTEFKSWASLTSSNDQVGGGSSGTGNVEAGWFTEYGGAPSLPEGTDGGVFNIDKVLTGTGVARKWHHRRDPGFALRSLHAGSLSKKNGAGTRSALGLHQGLPRPITPLRAHVCGFDE